MQVKRFEQEDQAIEYLYQTLVRRLRSTKPLCLVLAGGQSYLPVYRKLSQASIIWSDVTVCASDERLVPLDDDQSNYKMINQTLFSHLSVKPKIIWPNPTLAISEAVVDYQRRLPKQPDLSLLGIGPDGHTASLFPNQMIDHNNSVQLTHPGMPPFVDRITLTPIFLNQAAQTLFLANGQSKRAIIWDLTHHQCKDCPSRLITSPSLLLTDQPDLRT